MYACKYAYVWFELSSIVYCMFVCEYAYLQVRMFGFGSFYVSVVV